MAAHRVEPTPDLLIAVRAAEQHGVVSAAQLVEAGMTRHGIARRARYGTLHHIHRGVYAVGHPRVGPRGRWFAAVLACGDDAVLSHRAAAAAWELRDWAGAVVDVIVPSAGGRTGHMGVRVHRYPGLRPQETTVLDGLPLTTPERTIADLAAVEPVRRLHRAIEQGDHLRILDHAVLRDYAVSRRRGAPNLRAAMGLPATETRSPLEDLFLALCERHGIPRPLVNHSIEPYTVDFFWPEAGLVVETDSGRYHGDWSRREEDLRRDADLTVRGFTVVRFGYDDVVHMEARTAASVIALVTAPEARPHRVPGRSPAPA